MPYEQIITDIRDNILTITLDRPDKLNACTETMMRELFAVLDEVDANDDVRAVIVTGAGRAFCAGVDLSAGAGVFNSAARADTQGRSASTVADGGIDWNHPACATAAAC